MKLLIYGSNGWIAKQFIKILKEKDIEFIEGRERVDNTELLILEIQNILPTHIISFIGRTHGKIDDKIIKTIDYLEEDGKVILPASDKGSSCISCHSQAGNIDYMLMNKYFP